MADLLERMARASARRVAEAKAREREAALRRRACDAPPPVALELSRHGFDVIAEIKRRAPAAGRLADPGSSIAARAATYARAGAAAVSVLTEPDEFDGSLEDLRVAAGATRIPLLRKDFLVDPYQVFEARAAGASGVLLILRLLAPGALGELLHAAEEAGLFVLLEAFDAADIERLGALDPAGPAPGRLLAGVNARDLVSLAIDTGRFERLAPLVPAGFVRVAESGIASGADARRVAALGYRAALVGGVLMRAQEPGSVLGEMIRAGREEGSRSCACD